jgi:hypothetical protein
VNGPNGSQTITKKEFIVVNLGKPVLVSPTDGEQLPVAPAPRSITLSWKPVVGAAKYQYSYSGTASDGLGSASGAGESTVAQQEITLDFDGEWTWTVTPIGPNGDAGPTSEGGRFSNPKYVVVTPEQVAPIEAPSQEDLNRQASGYTSKVFKWKAVPSAKEYRAEFQRWSVTMTSSPDGLSASAALGWNDWAPGRYTPTPEDAGLEVLTNTWQLGPSVVWRWRIIAIDAAGIESAPSEWKEFVAQ